ncbi:MAG: nitroreductase family deazaflavin-dependent oxidoreductase [Actinomycetota bacterium]
MNDWNRNIIEEFRANGGKVGGRFEGADLLLLHTTGARSGRERVNPLAYQRVGGDYAVFGSKGGAPTHPDWYRNILVNPKVTVEVGTETFEAVARVAEGEERERIWTTQKARVPAFARYEAGATRPIPVLVLSPHR